MSEVALRPARVALVGNPNSGKTALFNALTGARQKVANYAGVTVERKEGHLQTAAGRTLSVLDLPGTYSLRARSPDEEVTRDAVLGKLAGADGRRNPPGAPRGPAHPQDLRPRAGAARHLHRQGGRGAAASGGGARHPADAAVRHVPGRVHLGDAGPGCDRRGLPMARRD